MVKNSQDGGRGPKGKPNPNPHPNPHPNKGKSKQQGMPNLPKNFMQFFEQQQHQQQHQQNPRNNKTKKQNNKRENSFGYYVRDRKSYKSSDKTSKGSTIKKHLKHLSMRVKKSYKLVSSNRDDYAQTTRTRLETANKAVKDVYMYLKNKDKRERKKRGKKSRKNSSNNSNNSSSSSD